MEIGSIEIHDESGPVLVSATDDCGTEQRFWGRRTDDGRLAVFSEVVDHGGERHYADEITIPDRVREYVTQNGYIDIVDGNGIQL